MNLLKLCTKICWIFFPDTVYIGKTRRLSTIFVHSYREPEVVVTYLDMSK